MTTSLKDVSDWRLSTASGIPYRMVNRKGSFEREKASSQEEYIIRSSDLVGFVLESFPAPLGLFGTVNYPPVRRMPGTSVMQSVKISWRAHDDSKPVDPFSADSSAPDNTYGDFLKLTIDYDTDNNTGGSNDSDPDPNNPFTFLEVSARTAGSFLYTPSRGSLTWVGYDGEDDIEVKDRDIPVSISQPETEWTLRWSQIPFQFFNDTLMSRLREKIGKVNSKEMEIFFDAPKETILFLGWSVTEQFTWRTGLLGKPPFSLEMSFLEKNFKSPDGVQVTHNHFYRLSETTDPVTKPGWRKILVNTSDGDKNVYESDDLNEIFEAN